MKAYTYLEKGRFGLIDKPEPQIEDPKDAIVRVTLGSICTSDLHIRHGSVPRAVPGITVGHEMVGVVEKTGPLVKSVRPGDRVTVNVETFCGDCFFCRNGYVNNCTDPDGGWALGCRIDGGQAEYVRVPYADQGLDRIPDTVTDEQALFVGDVLATGFWAARISEIKEDDTVLIIGAGPTGICTLLCVMLRNPERIIVCEKSDQRRDFVRRHYPSVEVVTPEECLPLVWAAERGGADVVIEAAGADDTFRLAWQAARPNAIVTVVALYDNPQELPLPDMYGKNLTFKTGGVDGCDCAQILKLIEQGLIDTTPLITHRFPLSRIEEAYRLFENKEDGVIKVALLNPHNKLEYGPAHSAEHILNATMVKMFGCPRSRNAHIERKKSKCDYILDAEPSMQQVAEIEAKVNEVISRNLDVTEEFMSREQASGIVDLSKIPEACSQTLRIVRIGDYDACACIGTHVANTSEIGTFRIISHSYADGVWRVRWKVADKG